jgi:hypothetical protein
MRISKVCLLICFAVSVALQGAVMLVTNPASLGASDSRQLVSIGRRSPGGAGDPISKPFSATSVGAVALGKPFAGAGGTVAVVCPSRRQGKLQLGSSSLWIYGWRDAGVDRGREW